MTNLDLTNNNTYKKLSKYCKKELKVKGESTKLGFLRTTDLAFLERKYSRKKSLEGKEMLKAIKFIMLYRTSVNIRYLENMISENRISKAEKKAEIITNWITKCYKNNEKKTV